MTALNDTDANETSSTVMAAEDFDEDAFIEAILGPKSVDMSVSVPVTSIYCCIWFFGMAGNNVHNKEAKSYEKERPQSKT